MDIIKRILPCDPNLPTWKHVQRIQIVFNGIAAVLLGFLLIRLIPMDEKFPCKKEWNFPGKQSCDFTFKDYVIYSTNIIPLPLFVYATTFVLLLKVNKIHPVYLCLWLLYLTGYWTTIFFAVYPKSNIWVVVLFIVLMGCGRFFSLDLSRRITEKLEKGEDGNEKEFKLKDPHPIFTYVSTI